MANIARSGASVIYYNPQIGDPVSNGDLQANSWYQISALATQSVFPQGMKKDNIFKTGANGPTLAVGDIARPLTLGDPIAKTEIGIQFEEGTIEVTDDSSGGYNSAILDGYVEFSGSLNGFFKYNEETEEIEDVSADVLSRFVTTVTDDGQGNYTLKEKENNRLLAFICLNKHAKIGQRQQWLIMFHLFASVDLGGGLKDAQKRDISVKKAEGPITHYVRTVNAGDEL